MDNIVFATEPNDDEIGDFDLLEDDGEDLLTVNLSPKGKQGRKKSSSFRHFRADTRSNATVPKVDSGRVSNVGMKQPVIQRRATITEYKSKPQPPTIHH